MRRLRLALVIVLTVAAACASPAHADTVPANSGLPGSTCEPTDRGLAFSAPDASISTTALGTDAPAYYEVGMPTGAFAHVHPKAVMLLIHGGGWYVVGPPTVAATRASADEWRAKGWMTVNLDYRACAKSTADVLWFMDRVRTTRPALPVCAAGLSAGAHLALMLASIRSDLACAISMGAATDLLALPTQKSWNPTAYTYDSAGASKLSNLAIAAFGSAGVPLVASSPIRYVANVRARVLVVSGEHDMLVPPAQTRQYAAALTAARPANYVDSLVLEPGVYPFVHTTVSRKALDALSAHIDALVGPIVN